MPKVHDVVLIDWLDACSFDGWRDEALYNHSKHCIEVRTYGRVVSVCEKELTITQSTTDHGQVSGILSVPVSCIKKIRRMVLK